MMYNNKLAVAIKSAGKVLREFNKDEVYVPFGNEYSIFVKNMNSVRALVKVSIDGVDVGDREPGGRRTADDLEPAGGAPGLHPGPCAGTRRHRVRVHGRLARWAVEHRGVGDLSDLRSSGLSHEIRWVGAATADSRTDPRHNRGEPVLAEHAHA